MKFKGLVALVFVAGIGASAAFFSCGKSDSDSSDDDDASSEGKDVTQAFRLAIKGASVEFPAGSLDAGSKVEIKTGTAPSEFAAEGVTGASATIEIAGTDAASAALAQVKAPMTVALDITAAAALADVEKTTANLCVLGKGQDGILRKWINQVLKVDSTTNKVKFPALWLGTFQALYCGENFAKVPAVNAEGTAVTEVDTNTNTSTATKTVTDTSTNTNTGTVTDTLSTTPCNTVVNDAPQINAQASGAAAPAAVGGTVLDGTYFLTSVVAYTGSPIQAGFTFKSTMVVTGAAAEISSENTGDDPDTETFVLTPVGTDPNVARSCHTKDEPLADYSGYTVNGNNLTFYVSTYNVALTYTKQAD